ncbi:MAG: hypothetical protein J5I53_00900 [Bradyrhizobiaceae bacterium]|nr:hypothetical protein [Bradyrhizobiaceae bacterium]
MKLTLLSLLQSICTVVGMGLINSALHGRPLTVRHMSTAIATIEGIAGIVLLLGSFVLTSVILTFAKVSVFVPLSTGLVFITTIVYATLVQSERISLPMALGMTLILAGIALVVKQQGAMQ